MRARRSRCSRRCKNTGPGTEGSPSFPTIMESNFGFGILLAAFLAAALSFSHQLSAQPRIAPTHTTATFSLEGADSPWSVPIKTANGRAAYVLSLEPQRDVGNRPVGVELILRRANSRSDGQNLLAPTGNWHGLQAYDFPGRDLAQGTQKTAFGEKRTIVVERLGLKVRIVLLSAKVSPLPLLGDLPPCDRVLKPNPPCESPDFQLESLALQVTVENSTPEH